jgi:hypothetical protein
MDLSTFSYLQIPHSVGRTTDNDIKSGSYHFYYLKGRGSIRGREVNFCFFHRLQFVCGSHSSAQWGQGILPWVIEGPKCKAQHGGSEGAQLHLESFIGFSGV